MEENLLTAGQFAKLARTTKRTITWYSDKVILNPVKISQSGYRLYEPRQILDFQVLLLLRRLRFSVEEIKEFLKKNSSLKEIFELKKVVVKKEINDLQNTLNTLNNYYGNLDKNGTLVLPKLKKIKPFSIYYIEKDGSYAKIKDYCLELKSYFRNIPKNSIPLTLFLDKEYQPKKAEMKIAVIIKKGLILKKEAENIVKKQSIPAYKALTYTHQGSGAVLSMLWQELAKYTWGNGYKHNSSLPFVDLELYHKTSLNGTSKEENMLFELHLPIL